MELEVGTPGRVVEQLKPLASRQLITHPSGPVHQEELEVEVLVAAAGEGEEMEEAVGEDPTEDTSLVPPMIQLNSRGG